MENATESPAQAVDPTRLAARGAVRVRKPHRVHLQVAERRLALLVGDLLAVECSVAVAVALWMLEASVPFSSDFVVSQAYWFVIMPALWLLLATANDYFNLRVTAKVSSSLWRLTSITGQSLLIYGAVFFLAKPNTLPRRFIVYYAVLSLVLIGAWRAARIFLIGWQGLRCRALIVGAGHEVDVIWQALKEEAAGDYDVIGVVASAQEAASIGAGQTYLGSGSELPDLVARYDVTELIMTYAHDLPDDVFKGLLACYESGIQVTPMIRLYQQITGRIPIEHVSERLWTMILPEEARSLRLALYAFWKRITDIALSLVGLTLFAPFLPLIALAIKLDSRGPVFYTQTRLGKGGAPFNIIKLRSMVVNAEHGSGPQWAQANDRRITRVGAFLRRTRLDEVPQLLSVLAGHMSLIGPRPERPEFVEQLSQDIPFYRARLAVKPGLSGWAQVRFRYGNSREDSVRKLEYDLYYIRHQSPILDLIISLQTVGVILLFRGM